MRTTAGKSYNESSVENALFVLSKTWNDIKKSSVDVTKGTKDQRAIQVRKVVDSVMVQSAEAGEQSMFFCLLVDFFHQEVSMQLILYLMRMNKKYGKGVQNRN